MIVRLLVFSWLVGVGSAQARIGETVAECTARYGQPVEHREASLQASDPDALLYSKSGVSILVEYHEGVAWRIFFRKADLTALEAEALLRANLPPGGWSGVLTFAGADFRMGGDRSRVSCYKAAPGGGKVGTLEVATSDYCTAKRLTVVDRLRVALTTGVLGRSEALDAADRRFEGF
ncbi:MAG: hypothetical protein H7A55_21810 [Verrucomicrobiaceae bacterium]|nr:hypothetical protein [Verrucomicrobiaceae bacterium]